MYKLLIFIILFIIIVIYYNVRYNGNNFQDKCIIPLNKYPELLILHKNKDIILDELKNLLHKKVWSKYKKLHDQKILYDDVKTIQQKIKATESYINFDKNNKNPLWLAYVLMIAGKPFPNADINCPSTIKILNQIPNITDAGFSCLEAGAHIPPHSDEGSNVYRYHFPLIIPEHGCNIEIDNIMHDFNNPFIFDDTCIHQVWNKSNDIRIVLIIDVLKKM